MPGGKGINVARVARTLGANVAATGFVAGYNGHYIANECAKQGISPSFCETEGESRICMTFLDQSSGAVTEVLEAGPVISQRAYDRFVVLLRQLASKARFVIFSGSLPPGLPVDVYRELLTEVRAAGAAPVLDTSGAALLSALSARPYLIKPNQPEAEALLGYRLDDFAAKRQAISDLLDMGAERVLLSLGEKGALFGDGTKLYQLPVLSLPRLVNPVGCGDSLLAGIITGLLRGDEWPDAARLGMASAAANALSLGAGSIRPEDVEAFLAQAVCAVLE